MSQNLPLGSCFIWIFRFSMLKASLDLPRPFGVYDLLLHTPFDLHQEANFHLLKSSNFLSIHWGIRIRNLHSSKFMKMEHYQDLLNSWRHVTTWTIQFKLKIEMNFLSMVKVKVLIRHLLISLYILYWNQFEKIYFVVLTISMPYFSPFEPRIDFVVMLLTSSGTEQDFNKNTSNMGCESLHNQWKRWKK